MRTLPRWEVASAIIACRSARENRGSPFWGLRTAATTTSSNGFETTSMISRWPLWMGSNDPG